MEFPPSVVGKMAEKAVANYLSLTDEEGGWWNPGQRGSRARRPTIDALAFLKEKVRRNRRNHRCTALVMTDVAAAFPSTTRDLVVRMLQARGANPTIIWWVLNWLSERSVKP